MVIGSINTMVRVEEVENIVCKFGTAWKLNYLYVEKKISMISFLSRKICKNVFWWRVWIAENV